MGRNIRYGNQPKMFKEHQVVLGDISKKYEEHSRLKKMVAQLQWDMKEFESVCKGGVLASKDGNGKPMYTNAEGRANAVESMLRANVGYNENRTVLDETLDQLIEVENEVKMLKHRLHFFESWSK